MNPNPVADNEAFQQMRSAAHECDLRCWEALIAIVTKIPGLTHDQDKYDTVRNRAYRQPLLDVRDRHWMGGVFSYQGTPITVITNFGAPDYSITVKFQRVYGGTPKLVHSDLVKATKAELAQAGDRYTDYYFERSLTPPQADQVYTSFARVSSPAKVSVHWTTQHESTAKFSARLALAYKRYMAKTKDELKAVTMDQVYAIYMKDRWPYILGHNTYLQTTFANKGSKNKPDPNDYKI